MMEKLQDGVEPDEKVRKTLICVGKKMGVLDSSGKIDKQQMTAKFHGKFADDDVEKKFFDECVKDGSTPDETVAAFLPCLKKYAVKKP